MEIPQLIPKKRIPPSLQNTMGTEGWGLHAVQGWSVLKIISWFIVTQVFGFVFVPLWLTLVNKTDLQNAFTPLIFFSTSVMVAFGICQFFTPA
jgi:predicted Kef-type K+ transport protein